MKNIFKLFILFIFTQTSFAQNFDKTLISKKSELNLFSEPNMRGIESNHIVYYIEKDMQTLSAYENGKLKWATNIISVCGESGVGKSEIRFLKLIDNKLSVVYGKHSFAEVDLKSGKAEFVGED